MNDSWWYKLYNEYRLESILIVIAGIICLLSFGQFFAQLFLPQHSSAQTQTQEQAILKPDIVVDVGGAVASPAAYIVPLDTRLYEILEKAGGLTKDADKEFFARNYNLSKVLSDQDKIYIPTKYDTSTKRFRELDRIVNATDDQLEAQSKKSK